jgi:hypothetical protein
MISDGDTSMRQRTPATAFGLFVMLAFLLATAMPGEADSRRGGGYRGGAPHRGHSGGWHHGGGRPHHYHHHPRWYGGRWRSGVFIGAPFLFAAPFAYRYPVYPPPVVVQPPPPVYAQPDPPPYWYYCQSAGAYYPNVGACPEGWLEVAPQPN